MDIVCKIDEQLFRILVSGKKFIMKDDKQNTWEFSLEDMTFERKMDILIDEWNAADAKNKTQTATGHTTTQSAVPYLKKENK